MKKFASLLLALVMVVALLPTIALAADETPAEPPDDCCTG